MKRKVDTTELENRVGEIYERIMKLEEQTLHNLKTLKTLRQDLRICQTELAKLAPVKKPAVKKPSAEELAVKKSPKTKPAKKKVARPQSAIQKSLNDMPFEERQKFLDSLRK